MAGTITTLALQKRDKERVNVFIDGQFAFAVTAIVATRLRKGQYLSDEEIETLKQGDERDKAYQRALRFLGIRPRSQVEIERYLTEKGYATEVIEVVVNRLVEQQYLDDEAFARFWLENREQFKPRGERALRFELRQKGIADNVIDKVIVDLDEDGMAWAAVESKLQRWQNLPEPELRKKITGFLARRGFGYEVINTVFRRAITLLNH